MYEFLNPYGDIFYQTECPYIPYSDKNATQLFLEGGSRNNLQLAMIGVMIGVNLFAHCYDDESESDNYDDI